MKNRRNYYRLLQVQPDAPVEVIAASYRTLMQKLKVHPDLGGDAQHAALINEAFAVLRDASRRADYDRSLRLVDIGRGECTRSAAPSPAGRPRRPAFESTQIHNCLFCGQANPVGERHLRHAQCSRCTSPLQPAERLEIRASCQRAVQRLQHHAVVSFFYWPERNAHTGRIRDLSPNGMQFLCEQALQLDLNVLISCEALSAVSRVSNCNAIESSGTYAVGVEFLTLRFVDARGTFLSARA